MSLPVSARPQMSKYHEIQKTWLIKGAVVLQEGQPLPGPETGLLSNTWNWIVQGDTSPFDLSWTLLVGGGLLALCSLAGPPVVKQLMQVVTMVPGQGGLFQCASPNSLYLLAVQGTLKSLLQHHSSLPLSFLYNPTLTSIHDYWRALNSGALNRALNNEGS